MRWFFDTEFDEDGKTIELISIGMISETGITYYAESSEYDRFECSEWVQQNVIPKLPFVERKSRKCIAEEIERLIYADHTKPEFWAYFADYDWVVLCQLYGRMIDLPGRFPQFCMDFKQYMVTHEIEKASLPLQKKSTLHNALDDACWVRDAWLYTHHRKS
jgi:hypothetical protein